MLDEQIIELVSMNTHQEEGVVPLVKKPVLKPKSHSLPFDEDPLLTVTYQPVFEQAFHMRKQGRPSKSIFTFLALKAANRHRKH